jgi:hypothetical protein
VVVGGGGREGMRGRGGRERRRGRGGRGYALG